MLRLVVLSIALVAVLGNPVTDPFLDGEWEIFKTQHNKQYGDDEELMRRLIFESNVRFIQKHNLEFDRGMHTYTVGMNEYGDMTAAEFKNVMNGYLMRNGTGSGKLFVPPTHVNDLPDEVDWRSKGYVTPVKNQGQCGSCWSFSATGSLEGQTFKKTNKLVSLSEQNLCDCSTREGNKGCKGGLMDQAFKYIKINNGIDTEASYPYKAKNGICKFKKADVGATDTGYTDLKSGSEEDLQQAVATVGPISVAMDAGHQSFQLYKTGIYTERKCSSRKLDHGVLAVGYGSDNGKDYWLVKNSWGTRWGMEGYFKLARNEENMCGLATQASYPTV